MVLCFVVALVGCGGESSETTRSRRSTTTTTTSTSTSTTPRRSAADDLAAYFDAARATDERLTIAARLVNAGIGPDELRFDQATVDAISAAEPKVAAAAIPAGLEPDLLRAVMLVQNDLASRHAALVRIEVGTFPAGEYQAQYVLTCLGNGSGAKARFTTDLAAAEAAAASAPPVVVAPADSRAAAEVAIRLQDIAIQNLGCDSCGGAVPPELAPITWQQEPGEPPWDGRIGDLQFRARYTAENGWEVQLNAC